MPVPGQGAAAAFLVCRSERIAAGGGRAGSQHPCSRSNAKYRFENVFANWLLPPSL